MASNSGSGAGGGKMKLKLNTAQATASTPKPDPNPTPSSGIKLNLGRPSQGSAASPTSIQQTTAAPTPKGGRKASTAAANTTTTPSSAAKASASKTQKTPASASAGPKGLKAIRLNANQGPQRKPSLIRLGSGKVQPSPSTGQPRLRVKVKGKIPTRPAGVGYDSECEDAEKDPAHEENFILRMPAGPDCDYVHKAIEEKKIGLPLAEGGADISMHIFSTRRAAVKVRGRTYAAVIVDLPCIVESMKSWDRKGWWKSADISQMMLVTRQIDNEDEARTAPLSPEIDDKTWQWPHGLTPPMHNVRKRRFRKRVSHKTIEQAEEEVERLLAEDEDAQKHGGTVRSELLDLEQLRREEEGEDGEGDMEVDESGYADSQAIDDDEEDDDDWAAQFEARLGEEDDAAAAPDTTNPPGTPSAAPSAQPPGSGADPSSQAPTPAVADSNADGDVDMADSPAANAEADTPSADAAGLEDSQPETPATPLQAESSSSDEDDEDDEDDDEDDEDVDDETRERMQYMAQQRDEIAHLDRQIAERREQLAKQTNPLLQTKLAATIKRFEEERDVKKRGMGIADDDDDDE